MPVGWMPEKITRGFVIADFNMFDVMLNERN